MSLMVRPPGFVRMLNRMLDALPGRVVALGAGAVRARAEWTTGLRDFGDDGFDDRLDACCAAVEAQPNLSPVGRIGVAVYLHTHAVNRLRLVDLLARHPEIDRVPVEAPVFIVGWYRTGTTSLHGLLAADPANRAARAWELFSPVPGERDSRWTRGRRRLRSRLLFAMNRGLVPEQAAAHAIPLDGPEECFFLLENDFVSSTLYNTFQAWDYAFDLLEQDLRPSYRFLRRQLQVLAWRQPARRWVLKSPFHLWHLDALTSVFPDARIVFTHRSIRQSLPSNCSLSAMTTSKFARSLDLERLGDFWRRYYRVGMDRAIEQRMKIPQDQMFDLPLERLAGEPVEAVRDLYGHLDLRFEEAAPHVERYAAELARSRSESLPHAYTLAQFGLDEESLGRQFADYESFVESLARRVVGRT